MLRVRPVGWVFLQGGDLVVANFFLLASNDLEECQHSLQIAPNQPVVTTTAQESRLSAFTRVGIVDDTRCRLAAYSAVDSLIIAVEMHNTFVRNVVSREMTSFNAVSVAKLNLGLQLCISIACNIPLC